MLFFFFQAEDGIRDLTVTGVQTCALPISLHADLQRIVLLAGLIGKLQGGRPVTLGVGNGSAQLHHHAAQDRKSTRLNSSHSQISYAVFCLKKKKSCVTSYVVL